MNQTIIDGVLAEFLPLCQIPHASMCEKEISDYLVERLQALGACVRRDEFWNIWADVPATAGREAEPMVGLQAHMDMVCAVGHADYQPKTDPVLAAVKDGWLSTNGRSALGADCGAGLAVILWLLAQADLSHPPLRILFTVQEEIGLVGAQALPKEAVAGISMLFNLDGFAFDRILVGAAGGVREHFARQLETVPAPAGKAYRIVLSGLTGGHSGFDIVENRANAIILMGEVLRRLQTKTPFAIASFAGGEAFNAIAYQCTAEIVSAVGIDAVIAEIAQDIAARHRQTDPQLTLFAELCAPFARVWDGSVTMGFLTLLGGFANGIYAMDTPDLVSDSSNLGRVYVQDGILSLDAMIRFTDHAAQTALHTSHVLVAGMSGFTGAIHKRYPAWQPKKDGVLAQRMAALFRIHTGREPQILTQHVGLEPSYLIEKNPDMECVCMGMDIEGCHSPEERWRLDTIPPFVRILKDYLENK